MTHSLSIDVFNPGPASIFPVSSVLISGEREAVLIDAQFQRNDAEALVEKIKAGGRKLTTIYISHSDPDYYFGLDTLHTAFPEAKIIASAPTVAAIEATKEIKLAYWGPQLKDNVPKAILVPEVLDGDRFELEGHTLQIIGLDGATPARSLVWIDSLKAVVGGIPVQANQHVWMADTATLSSRQNWLKTLEHIQSLNPELVIPGHYQLSNDGEPPYTIQSVAFMQAYLELYEKEVNTSETADALIAAMLKHYPDLADRSYLELGAKVVKGELQWP
ncbi:hypothetical protein F993_03999 [Acinetobacter proteolyticus]|uniref:MBL fold metallo-hydrolase n=1 Tax=Acinetobacter proteolyticus TaxID=1776741 RepID=A0A2N0WIJ5_9GAMM|nr:MBL fold metallo-hydrolase [Acinetobacter proteolyticus]ENU21508.1 hypothetical protein F993_03999 [Acinetobacter proteolyticus]OJU55591.1 MAG: MBL fold metallo-hydrolase [Acinetobacter sp. 39-4]PKF35724.1 MBL fold metallo-hydrolase [Acinetobacter proteolyticus]QHH94074.1 MBL fold metallo-hydrolase [Acinetobacter gyllenbergii]